MSAALRLFHNPRCSKSRQTLALLKDKGVDPEIVDYQSSTLTADDFAKLCEGLGVEPQAIIRFKDELARTLGLAKDDERSREEWLRWLADHPALLERPVAVRAADGRAAIGRPPENVLALLDGADTGAAGAGRPPA